MSMRQLCYQLDPFLNETFKRKDLDDKNWFSALELLVNKHKPRRYDFMNSYDIVLAYVKFKANYDVSKKPSE